MTPRSSTDLNTSVLIGSPDTLNLSPSLLNRVLKAGSLRRENEAGLLLQTPQGWTLLSDGQYTHLGGSPSDSNQTVIRAALPAGRQHLSRMRNNMIMTIFLSGVNLANHLTGASGPLRTTGFVIALLSIAVTVMILIPPAPISTRTRELRAGIIPALIALVTVLISLKLIATPALSGPLSLMAGTFAAVAGAVILSRYGQTRAPALVPVELRLESLTGGSVEVSIHEQTVHLQITASGHPTLPPAHTQSGTANAALHPALQAAITPILDSTDQQGSLTLLRACEELRTLSETPSNPLHSQQHYLLSNAQQRAAAQIQGTDPQTAVTILGLALNEARLLSRPQQPPRPEALQEARHYYAQTTPRQRAADETRTPGISERPHE